MEEAKKQGVELHYVNTRMENATEYLRELSSGTGYDDVICFAPVRPVIEQGGDILGSTDVSTSLPIPPTASSRHISLKKTLERIIRCIQAFFMAILK